MLASHRLDVAFALALTLAGCAGNGPTESIEEPIIGDEDDDGDVGDDGDDGKPARDASTPRRDASTPPRDASAPARDASAPLPSDAGTPPRDASAPNDASAPRDAGMTPTPAAGDRTPDPKNIPECPKVAPENPVGSCIGVPVYATCSYTTYHCICDWYHWLCI